MLQGDMLYGVLHLPLLPDILAMRLFMRESD